jgi:sugar lactone lactonase YvrE
LAALAVGCTTPAAAPTDSADQQSSEGGAASKAGSPKGGNSTGGKPDGSAAAPKYPTPPSTGNPQSPAIGDAGRVTTLNTKPDAGPTTPEPNTKTDSYAYDGTWPNLPGNFEMNDPAGVAVNNRGDLVVFHRSYSAWSDNYPLPKITKDCVATIDKDTGQIIDSWGSNTFMLPHGLYIDDQSNVWVTDVAAQQVFKFTATGMLLGAFGVEGVAGDDSSEDKLNYPTDVTVTPNGFAYVSDGYNNHRVVKLTADLKFVKAFVAEGPAINNVHGISSDSDGNLYVADRENNKIHKFDKNERWLKSWNAPANLYAVEVNKGTGQLFATTWNGQNSDILRLSLDLVPNLQFGSISGTGGFSGGATRYHDIAVDADGHLYVGDITSERVQRFLLTP